MAAPITHDTTDAGPATTAALRAPSSHPDPMIDPSEIPVRPQKPTLRCSPASALTVGLPTITISAITSPPSGETRSRRRAGPPGCHSPARRLVTHGPLILFRCHRIGQRRPPRLTRPAARELRDGHRPRPLTLNGAGAVQPSPCTADRTATFRRPLPSDKRPPPPRRS